MLTHLEFSDNMTEAQLPHWHSVVSVEFGLHASLASFLHLEISNDVNEVTADLHEYK